MKKQKLSIKNNWDKNLTLSPENKQMIKGGLSAERCVLRSVKTYCEKDTEIVFTR
jgi:hypothetical protein